MYALLRNMPYASCRLCTTGSTTWMQNANGPVCYVIFSTISFEITLEWKCACLYACMYMQSIFPTASTNKMCTHTQALSTYLCKTHFKNQINGNYTFLCICAFVCICICAQTPVRSSVHALFACKRTVYCIWLVAVCVNCHPRMDKTRRWRRKWWYKLQNMANFSMTSLIWY